MTPPLALGTSESHPTSLFFDIRWFFYIVLASLLLLLFFFQIVSINPQCPVSNVDSHPGLSFTVVAQIRSDVMQSVSTTIHVLLLNDTRFAPSFLDF